MTWPPQPKRRQAMCRFHSSASSPRRNSIKARSTVLTRWQAPWSGSGDRLQTANTVHPLSIISPIDEACVRDHVVGRRSSRT